MPDDRYELEALSPEQIAIVNDMICAWLDKECRAEYREIFRNDCKRLLRTASPAASREEVARKICEHIYGPLTWDRPEEEGTRNLCRGAADAILSLRAATAGARRIDEVRRKAASGLTRVQFVTQMIIAYGRVYPGITAKEAMRMGSQTYRDFIFSEKIKFGDLRYDWTPSGAEALVCEYENLDPKSLPSVATPAGKTESEYLYDDERFNKGVQHVVDMLARELGVSDWVAGDGSEDYDCDLWQTILNIFAAKGLYDKDEGEFAKLPAPGAVAEPVAWLYEYNDIHDYWRPSIVLNIPVAKNPPTSHHGKPVRNVCAVYTRPAPALAVQPQVIGKGE